MSTTAAVRTAAATAAFRDRFCERNRVRDLLMSVKAPFRAVAYAAGVDHREYWRGATTPAQNARVNAIALECAASPERVAEIREAFYLAHPDLRPVFTRRVAGVRT